MVARHRRDPYASASAELTRPFRFVVSRGERLAKRGPRAAPKPGPRHVRTRSRRNPRVPVQRCRPRNGRDRQYRRTAVTSATAPAPRPRRGRSSRSNSRGPASVQVARLRCEAARATRADSRRRRAGHEDQRAGTLAALTDDRWARHVVERRNVDAGHSCATQLAVAPINRQQPDSGKRAAVSSVSSAPPLAHRGAHPARVQPAGMESRRQGFESRPQGHQIG